MTFRGKSGDEVGGNERGLEGPDPSVSNNNNSNGNGEAKSDSVAGPTYEDVCEVLDARERRTDDVSERDYEAHQRRKEEERSTLPEVRAQVRRRVEDMAGVPRWGRIDKKTKPAGAIRVLSLNPNGLPQWSRKNYKADRLKFMVQEYDPDTVGLQELC